MFDPDRHYLILTHRAVQHLGEISGRAVGHEIARSALVASLKTAGVWRGTRDGHADNLAFVAETELFGIPVDVRVTFNPGDVAPDGKKTTAFVTHVFKPRANAPRAA